MAAGNRPGARPDRRTEMPKGVQRSNKEAKKPKKPKQPTVPGGASPSTPAAPGKKK